MKKSRKTLGIYVHIPFCIKKCNYCDFCSFSGKSGELMRAYSNELCRRISAFANERTNDFSVDTVYFGGGTPTLLSPSEFEMILDSIFCGFSVDANAEITVECNPASIDKRGFGSLRQLGVNRLSIGVQSANDNELSALGRVHDFSGFKRTFGEARDAGFDNISADVMYGIPEQTIESFKNTLNELCKLSPEHISAYGLKIEDGTQFAKIRDSLNLPDEDSECDMYSMCVELLEEQGYDRYEISNFSRSGRESRHNLKYWLGGDYIGFGVSAHSLIDGRRFSNSRDMESFLLGKDIIQDRQQLTNADRLSEYVMLRLRLSRGIDLCEYRTLFGKDFITDRVKEYISAGFFALDNGRLSFTTKGFFVSNSILSDIIEF